MQKDLENILKKIEQYNPISIFLYGSRARTDATEGSDYELGVLFKESEYIKRSVLNEGISETISIYPFKLEEVTRGSIDTPFNKNIYLHELKKTGETLFGEDVIKTIEPPAITTLDVLADTQFNLGRALSAVITHRDGSIKTAEELFSKSCLFAVRAFIIYRTRKLCSTYDEVVSSAKNLDLGEFSDLPQKALEVRKNALYDPNDLFRNISLLNQICIPQIREGLEVGEELIK